MEEYRCQCGEIFETPEEYHKHLKIEIQQDNQKAMEEEAGLIYNYYNEVGR